MKPSQKLIDDVFAQIEEKLASRYISDGDLNPFEYGELANFCCGPGKPCPDQHELCWPFSTLRRSTMDNILWNEIAWKEAESADDEPTIDPESFTDTQIQAIIDNVIKEKSRDLWLENVPGVLELVKDDGKTSLDELLKRASGDLKIVEPEKDHGLER